MVGCGGGEPFGSHSAPAASHKEVAPMSRPPRSRASNAIRVMTVPPPQKEQPPPGSTALLVKILRKVLLDLTQAELAARSGVDADLISRYENGAIRKPIARNLDRLLTAAGVLDLKQPLLRAADHLAALLGPTPMRSAPTPGDPLRIRNLLQHTARRLRQPDSRILPGEYSPPIRRDLERSEEHTSE